MPSQPSKELLTVPNPYPDREYTVTISSPEFTCLCPMTGQPDFAEIRIVYTPGPRIVELKSLKLYLWSFRNEGAFHERVINEIMDDFVAAADPIRIEVSGDFLVRGGLHTIVTTTYERAAHAHGNGRQAAAAQPDATSVG
ncbi:MAG: preQ(1) synthase [Anaerolineae bacterium]